MSAAAHERLAARADAPGQDAGAPARSGPGPSPKEIQVPVLESLDRAVTGLITAVPPMLLVLAGWQLWDRELRWRDLAILAVMYVPVGLGVTVGFHRLL